MIKFFLHGGVTSPRTEKNKEYFQRVVQEGGNKILIFPFAQKNNEYQVQFEVDKKKFEDHNPDMQLEIIQASEDIETLQQQIQDAEVLYFCGGLQEGHLEILRQIPYLRELLDGKVVSGNSAGTMIWFDSFFTGDYNRLEKGLGLLNSKVMVHWKSEKYANYSEIELKKLQEYGEDLPIVCIREQEWVEFCV